MIDSMRKEAITFEMDIMEKEILYLKGRMRIRAKKAYFRLLKSFSGKLGLDQPIYLMRCE